MIKMMILLLIGILPKLAMAQSAPDAWAGLEKLQAGERVEVIDSAMKRYSGKWMNAGLDELNIETAGGPQSIRKASVVRVSRQDPSRRMRNTLLGAAIGTAAGVAIGAIVNPRFSNEGRDGVGYLIATPIGAGIGAGLGAASGGFETVYRAKP